MIKHLGIVAYYNNEVTLAAVSNIVSILQQKNIDYTLADDINHSLVSNHIEKAISIEDLVERVDLVLVVGGDGSMLRTATLAVKTKVPIVGVNLGRLGFLTQIQPKQFEAELDRILQNEYEIDNVTVIQVSVEQQSSHLALNDIVIQSNARLIDLKVVVNNKLLTNLRADGVLVATPIGSTAYALSCGGAILSPQLPCLQIVPINPHTLNSRPIVVPIDTDVLVELVNDNYADVQVVADGKKVKILERGQTCHISNYGEVSMLSNPDRDFFTNLHTKMQITSL